MPFILMITEQSIGQLLVAGILPGIMAAIVIALFIYALCKVKPALAPIVEKPPPWKERVAAMRHVWATGAIFLS